MLDFFGASSGQKQSSKPPGRPPVVTTTTTVKRRPSPAPARARAPHHPSVSAARAPTTNALSLDVRERLARERDARTPTSTPPDTAASERPRKRRRPPPKKASSPSPSPSPAPSTPSETDTNSSQSALRAPAPPRRRRERDTTSASTPVPSGFLRLGRTGVASEYHVPRECVEDAPFPSGLRPTTSRQLVEQTGAQAFQPFFKDLPVDTLGVLEYPAVDACEEYLLVSPRSEEEYDPIAELLRVVYAVVASYVDPAIAQDTFGALDDLETGPTSLAPPPKHTPSAPATPSHVTSSPPQDEPILRSFTKARNRRDGRLFLQTLQRYNRAIRELKQSGALLGVMRRQTEKQGVPEAVWSVIQAQCYARAVGPHVDGLAEYQAFSDNVYGELLPVFMSEIAQLTNLGPGKKFLDLGSGVGNLLVQTAVQTGARADGVEIMKNPAACAQGQLAEARVRFRMWALNAGPMHAWRADFCEDAQVRRALASADVVLVNNYAFTPATNETLSLQFLDLKDGAKIVSLRPFVPPDFKLSERTMSSPLAILRVEEREHARGAVSWAERGGKYYIQTVDRELVRNVVSALGDSPKRKHRPKYRRLPDDSDDDLV